MTRRPFDKAQGAASGTKGRLRVLLVRPAGQADALVERLQAMGIDPVVVPAVAILPPVSWDSADGALRALARYAWVLFTSANGVRMFFERRQALGAGDPLPPTVRWAAIGPGTAAALDGCGVTGAWLPSRYLGETAGDELPVARGQRVLRVRGDAASPVPTQRLRARGAVVDEVVVYRTIEAPPESETLLRRAWAEGIDAVVFTSASTVRGFAQLAQRAGIDDDIGSVMTIAIGPVTAEAMASMKWDVDAVAPQYSIEGILEVLEERRATLAAGHATP